MVGTGISATNITTGTLPIAQIADGSITNAKLATGIDASKITAGTLPTAQIADASITNAKLIGIDGGKITGTVAGASVGAGRVPVLTLFALMPIAPVKKSH